MLVEFATEASVPPPMPRRPSWRRRPPSGSWRPERCSLALGRADAESEQFARATAKSFDEPVAVVAQFAVSTLRQTAFVSVQSGSRTLVCSPCSGPFFVSPCALSTRDNFLAEERQDVM